MQNMPDSLKRIIEKSPNLEHRVRGLPNLGENLIDGQFSKEVGKIYDAFGLYGNELYSLENEKKKDEMNLCTKSENNSVLISDLWWNGEFIEILCK